MPLPGLHVRGGNGLGALKEFLRLLACLCRHFGREPEIAVRFSHVYSRVRKHAIPTPRCEPANVIGVKVSEEDQIDLTCGVARASEIRRALSVRGSTVPPAGSCVDEDQMLAGID